MSEPPRWIILRTSAARTVPLAKSLAAAGHDVWTPTRTIRKVLRPGKPNEQRIEVDVPILASFVFAGAAETDALFVAARRDVSPHPAFSIFHQGERVPEIGDGQVQGLRAQEAEEAAAMQAIRDAESHEEAERIRIAAVRSRGARRRAAWAQDRARIQALRSQPRNLTPGDEVRVADMPALEGVTGMVETYDGMRAAVRFGALSWKIEGWRLMPAPVQHEPAPRGTAA